METEQIKQIFKGHTGGVISVAWSPNGKVIASSSYDNTIRLWDMKVGRPLRTFIDHEDVVSCVAWSSKGILASGSDDQTVRLWNPKTGQNVRTYTGHSGWVISVAWSPDGQLLASGSGDSTICLWNPKESVKRFVVRPLTGERVV
jgi:WD40 repeat protein